ncbi:uncharacterized protein METZ01_LOCUS348277, partial [marine metagenome]
VHENAKIYVTLYLMKTLTAAKCLVVG